VIITLSGTPGNGKNQIISGLKEHGFNVTSKQGADGTMEGQFALVENYKSQMEKCSNGEDVCIFESSFIDMIVYTSLWIGVYDDNVVEVKTLREKCIDYQNRYVDINYNLLH
jgi:predicted ATPase